MCKFLCFFSIAFLPLPLFAQENIDTLLANRYRLNLDYTSLYKENSQMSYTSPFGELGAPSGYVLNGKLTTTYMVFAPQRLPIAFSLNPDFTVRVRTDRSAGVRTPSFRFGGVAYLRLTNSIQHYRYATLSFTHHSNGQDADAILSDGSINTSTGNFNTNYLSVGYRFGHYSDRTLSADRYFSYHHNVGLEWHKWFNYEPALAGDYGFTRIAYDFSFRMYQVYESRKAGWKRPTANRKIGNRNLEKETWRFDLQSSYAVNRYDHQHFFAIKRRLNTELAINYSLPFMQNVFLMACIGYYGEDPYNIYFKDRYAFARFGLSSTFTRYRVIR